MAYYHVSAIKTVTNGSMKSQAQVGVSINANSASEAKDKARQQFFRDGMYEKYTNITAVKL